MKRFYRLSSIKCISQSIRVYCDIARKKNYFVLDGAIEIESIDEKQASTPEKALRLNW